MTQLKETDQMQNAIRFHYKKFIDAKLYHTIEFVEYVSQKLDIPERDVYQIIKTSKVY